MGPVSSTVPRRRASRAPGRGRKPRNPKQLPTPAPAAVSVRAAAAADQKQARQRDDLIMLQMPMATRIARSFAARGQDLDDLIQVAMLELVRAAGRFDTSYEVTFAQYAYPCIIGAVKKHFRDNGWSMHITRRMQELHLRTSRAIPGLTQLLCRTPTVQDLAIHLNLSEKDTREGLQSRFAYQTLSLDQPAGHGDEGELSDQFGGLDSRLENAADRHTLAQYVAAMPQREQSILFLRFTGDLTQREIAEQLGISQMHVSRLLSHSLRMLRTMLLSQQ